MTRRRLFQMLAGLPLVWRWATARYAAQYQESLRRSLAAERQIWIQPAREFYGPSIPDLLKESE